MEYKASLDTLAKTITIGIFILFITIGQHHLRIILANKDDSGSIWIHSILLLLLVAVIFGSWLYAPQSYSIDNSEFTINRPIGKIRIKRSDITQVRTVEENEMNGTIRTFGVGGLFGYFGKFHTPKIGTITFYATKRQNRILMFTNQNKNILITPDDISIIEKIKRQS